MAAIDLAHFIVHNKAVKRVDIHGAKTKLALELPLPLEEDVGQPRIGVAKGEFVVPDSFFDPLQEEVLKSFSGRQIRIR